MINERLSLLLIIRSHVVLNVQDAHRHGFFILPSTTHTVIIRYRKHFIILPFRTSWIGDPISHYSLPVFYCNSFVQFIIRTHNAIFTCTFQFTTQITNIVEMSVTTDSLFSEWSIFFVVNALTFILCSKFMDLTGI